MIQASLFVGRCRTSMQQDDRVITYYKPSRRKCEPRNEGDDLSFLRCRFKTSHAHTNNQTSALSTIGTKQTLMPAMSMSFRSLVSANDPYLTFRLDLSKECRGIKFSRRRPATCEFAFRLPSNADRAQACRSVTSPFNHPSSC